MRLVLPTLLVLASCASPSSRPTRPNLVFILLDNVGQEWFGCYGSEESATPNIDALARGGVRFEQCTTHPVCGPSRVMLLTGRYPFRTGWTMHHDAALYGGGGLDPARETVVARPLREAGYATAIAGKWQVNNLYDEPGVLARHGFDEHLVWPGSIDRGRVSDAEWAAFQEHVRQGRHQELAVTNRKIESRYWDPVLIRDGRREVHPGRFGPDLLQEFALDFIRRRRDGPFFLYYPMVLTHGQSFLDPVVPTPLNRGKEPGEHEKFADMLRYADRLIGEIARAVDDRTVLFVASDNGTEKSLTARRNGRAVRGGLYQLTGAGGSVAFLANGPGIAPGRTGALADFSDVFPTLCELAGAAVPGTVDGRSLAPFLLGRATDVPREWIFNQYHTRRVVQDRRYKLYSTGELYDVVEDPEESQPLGAIAARGRLETVLRGLPPDTPLPFPVRSLSAWQLRAEGKMK